MNHLPDMVDRRAVGEMAAGGQVEAHERVARLQQREEHRLVGSGARMGLDIGEARSRTDVLARSMASVFDHIDIFAAAVIALAGIAFGIFVGQDRALRLQHRPADDVLRGDQFDLFLLALEFVGDGVRHLRVGLRQPRLKKSEVCSLILSTTDTTICLVGTAATTRRKPQPTVAALGVVPLSLYQI